MTHIFDTVVEVHSPAAMEALARRLSLWIRPGLVVALKGDLGTGKSTFARAFIRAVADTADLDVPSPTFSLLQHYDDLRVPLLHADLYRLHDARESAELGLEEFIATHGLLIEWPERMDVNALSGDMLALNLSGNGTSRTVGITAAGRWAAALKREDQLTAFLAKSEFRHHERRFFLGDASTRRYETLHAGGNKTLLMDMPERSDTAAVHHGKSYSALVHLADSIPAVLAINQHLHGLGYSAPQVYASDHEHGFAAMEFLEGDVHGAMMVRGDDMWEPMGCAVDLLADMATHEWPRNIKTVEGGAYTLSDFDIEALVFETSLMPTWFWPHLHGTAASPELMASFENIWRNLLPPAFDTDPIWVLRDFHSPNLIWMPQRQKLRRTGLIDTQDAVVGHPAYDLVSLLQDARVDVQPAMQDRLYARYVAARQQHGAFDATAFAAAFASLGAQRATRLLGTFTRLSKRDGKHHYLQHRPRVARYLLRNLAHPHLKPLLQWYQAHLPEALQLATP